ncbi:MFS transporter [Salinibacterium soli]|uniref:MFS transporter n=1 Tax=Antiquaquibacter soli TaxID=3064523 RepID=A0ABT9BRE8_9MICO|nr:MFS transporter [Protaetiibacter sp. WY-16]MDO7883590.1 MFS transporter [Protaetiibacter sp. WY-16]
MIDSAPPKASLLRAVGWSYFPVAFIGRLPFAMTVVGVLTLVATVRESYTEAGLTSAFVGIGSAVCGPFLGALADRLGQRPVLLVAAALNAAALLAITALVYGAVGLPVVLAAAFFVGATSPQLSPMSRTRLVAILGRTLPIERHAKAIAGTMSYESMADELVFVFGPLLVGVLAFLVGPWSPIVIAAVLTLVFVGAFALHPTARVDAVRAGTPAVAAPRSELFRAGILVLAAGTVTVGFFFGAALTSLTAFMGVYAEVSQAGIVYGAMGIGSAAFALGIVLLPERFPYRWRWMLFAVVALAGSAAMPFVQSIPAMVAVLLVTGFGIGPILVTLFSLTSVRSPAGRATTTMTLVSGGVILGQSLSSAITGAVADAAGHSTAFLLVVASTAVLVVLGVVNWAIERGPGSRLDA